MRDNSPTISLCMIVKNEEEILPKCINSIKPYIDEIILVDTGSSDKTVETAKELGCKVFKFVWDNNFSNARNFALQQASGDWILVLDADHIFYSSEKDVLKKFIVNTQYLGLMIDEHTATWTGEKILHERLFMFQNHLGFRFSGLVFEHPTESIEAVANKNKINEPFGRINNCQFDHMNKMVSPDKILSKFKLVKEAIKREPDNFHYIFNYILILKRLGYREEFKKVLLKAVYTIEQKNPVLNESIVGLWAQFGEWILKDNNSDLVEKFYLSAKVLNEKTKWSDIRLVWPYVKISILQQNYDKAMEDLKCCIKNGLVPAHVLLNKDERIAPVHQLLKLINDEKNIEDFVEIVLDLDDLLLKTGILRAELMTVLKNKDQELFHSILDILGEEEIDENYPSNTFVLNDLPDKPFISLCMIIKNEKLNIDKCLESVQGVADEIIIVDTGSSDGSLKIAEKYNPKILIHKWMEDFSKARNAGLEIANGQWILIMDADEELHKSTREKLIPELTRTAADALNVIIRKHQTEEDVLRYIDSQSVRIFRNNPHYRFKERLHSKIIPSIAENGGSFSMSSIIINNYGAQQQSAKRHKRNIPLLSQGLKEHPKDAYMLFKLAETYKSLNNWEKARKYYSQAIGNPEGNISNEIKELIYLRLAQICLANDEYNSTKKYAMACLRFNGRNAMAKFIMGVTSMHLGEIQSAVRIFKELRATKKIHGLDLSDVETYLEALEQNTVEEILN